MSDRAMALAFARGFVRDLGGPDEALLARLDVRAHLVSSGCLQAAIDDRTQWCGSFRALDRIARDAAALRTEQREMLARVREVIDPSCTFTTGGHRVLRSARYFGNLDAVTGQSDASAADLDRYRRFIESILDERRLELRCGDRTVSLWVVRFQGEGYRAYGISD